MIFLSENNLSILWNEHLCSLCMAGFRIIECPWCSALLCCPITFQCRDPFRLQEGKGHSWPYQQPSLALPASQAKPHVLKCNICCYWFAGQWARTQACQWNHQKVTTGPFETMSFVYSLGLSRLKLGLPLKRKVEYVAPNFFVSLWSTVRLRFRKSISGHNFQTIGKLAKTDFQ